MNKIYVLVLMLATCAVAQSTKSQASNSSNALTQGCRTGRYQIFFSPHARADVYLLDTETGRVWHPVTITNAQDTNLKGTSPEIWVYEDRIDDPTQFAVWSLTHKPPPSGLNSSSTTPPQ